MVTAATGWSPLARDDIKGILSDRLDVEIDAVRP
jgi:hypothetical protein